MATLGPELTFIPRKHPHEILDEKAGEALILKITRWFHRRRTHKLLRTIYVKLDPHHNEYSISKDKLPTYCVEICPLWHWNTEWFEDEDEDGESGWSTLRPALVELFKGLRDRFDLVPAYRTTRDGVEHHWPGGGCHLHYGIGDLFSAGPLWYEQMKRFHENLLVDLTNRPYIRWLFKQWFADDGTHKILTLEEIKSFADPATGLLSRDKVINLGYHRNSIEPRFMPSSKGVYPTFEFRMFSMIETPDELRLIVRFLDAWVKHVEALSWKPEDLIQPIITVPVFERLSTVEGGRAACAQFITQLGLEWSPYSVLFKRHYKNRVLFGKMV